MTLLESLNVALEQHEDEMRTTPLTMADKVMFYLQLSVVLTNIPLVLYIIWNRKYPPIKSKQVWLTSALGISVILLSISVSVMFGSVGQTGVFEPCHAWGSWLLLGLGVGPFFSIANYRLIVYYRVFIAHQLYSFRRRRTISEFIKCYWPLFALYFPSIVSCIVTEIIPYDMSAMHIVYNGLPTCLFRMNYAYWIFAYYFAQIIVSWALYFSMLRIARAFNEFKSVMPGLIILTISFITTAIVVSVGGAGYVWGRTINAVCFSFLINSYFWLIVVKPILGHMFNREKCLKEFLESMHEDGLTAVRVNIPGIQKHLYNVEGTFSSSNTRTNPFHSTGDRDFVITDESDSSFNLPATPQSRFGAFGESLEGGASGFNTLRYATQTLDYRFNPSMNHLPPVSEVDHVRFQADRHDHIL